jgi:hypothetical protein
VKKLNFNQKRVQPVEESRLPFVEWKKITFIALPTIAMLSLVEAFLSQGSIEDWLLWITGGVFLFLALGVFLGVRYQFKLNFAPLTIFLLVSPLLVGDRATEPWMSIGLVCMAAVIYFSVITNVYLAVSVSIAIAVWQVLIASMNLSSVTDSRDVVYLSGYFSTTWMLAVGIGSILIRRKYQEVTEKVDDVVAESLNETANSLKRIQESNVTDSNNLRLHGTVLNTLIYLKNATALKIAPSEIRKILAGDLQGIRPMNENFDQSDLRESILASLEERTLNRIKVHIAESKVTISDRITGRGVIEILREQILNLEKHSDVTSVDISFNATISTGVHILTKSKAPHVRDREAAEMLIGEFEQSKSLAKILLSYRATNQIIWNSEAQEIVQEVFVPYLDFEEELQSSISDIRFTGLNDFAMNYVRIAIFSSLAALFGYIFAGIALEEWFLIAALTFALFLATDRPQSKWLLVFTSIGSASLLPLLFSNIDTCDDVLLLPWIWNLLLVNGFLVALRARNLILQTVPLIVLAIQSYLYPRTLPPACQNILDGSLPAIPLIAILAINIIRLRKREFDLDVQRVEKSATEFNNFGDIDQSISQQYRDLVAELDAFVTYQDFDLPQEKLSNVFELQIQKIRAYLISVEKYDSALIRELYGYIKNRLGHGYLTRLSLLGEFDSRLDSNVDIPGLLKALEDLLGNKSVEIILTTGSSLEVSIYFPSGEIPMRNGLPYVAGVTFELLSH